MPFKEDAFRASTRVTERAAAAGVVSTIQVETDGTLLGDNTDGAGLVADLLRHTALVEPASCCSAQAARPARRAAAARSGTASPVS